MQPQLAARCTELASLQLHQVPLCLLPKNSSSEPRMNLPVFCLLLHALEVAEDVEVPSCLNFGGF